MSQNVIKTLKNIDNTVYTLYQENFNEEDYDVNVFGIAIENLKESVYAPAISTKLDEVSSLFDLISSTITYPCSLTEIVEDFII